MEKIKIIALVIAMVLVGCGEQNKKIRNPCIEIHGFPSMRSGISAGWNDIFKDTLKSFYQSSYRNYDNVEINDKNQCEPFPHLIYKLELWEEMYHPDSMLVMSATTITAGAFPQKNLKRDHNAVDSATYVIVNGDKVSGTTGNLSNYRFKNDKGTLVLIFEKILKDLDPYKDLGWYMPFCEHGGKFTGYAVEQCP